MRVLTVLLLVFFSVGDVGAQRFGPAPKRPRHASVADTNDARAYFQLGVQMLEQDPDLAADAFYWAARMDPASGESIYGYAVGTVARNRSLLNNFMRRGRNGGNKDLRRVDSLLFRARIIDPFLFERLDRTLFTLYVRRAMEDDARTSGGQLNLAEFSFAMNSYLGRADQFTQAWVAAADGRNNDALRLYADIMKREKKKAYYLIERGRIFARTGSSDSAIASFQAALTEMRAADAKELVILYNSKAVLEHGIAVLLEANDDNDGAREAYGRALQEDLSYYPAHLRLGLLATTLKDSAAAFSEMELAVQAAPTEPYPHFIYATSLASFGDADRAISHLQDAVKLEPMWASPYSLLAQLFERKGDGAKALESYDAFFARAARSHPLYQQIKTRQATLKDMMGIKP